MKSLLPFLLLALAPAVMAAPERTLGQGLAYCRVHDLPADLPPADTRPGALVLDLRFAHGDAGSAAALGPWLKAHSSAATPVFVLVNADTAPAVLAYFARHEPDAGLITLGLESPRFAPDIALHVSPAEDRRAYEAVEHGTPVDAVLTDSLVKPRHDEASLAQDRTAADEDPAEDEPAPAAPSPAPVPPPPVVDHVLRRAVQLHRTLLALRKI